jgi:hypothetical protein
VPRQNQRGAELGLPPAEAAAGNSGTAAAWSGVVAPRNQPQGERHCPGRQDCFMITLG